MLNNAYSDYFNKNCIFNKNDNKYLGVGNILDKKKPDNLVPGSRKPRIGRDTVFLGCCCNYIQKFVYWKLFIVTKFKLLNTINHDHLLKQFKAVHIRHLVRESRG